MQELLLENAYILHRRPWRESSFILDVFSREFGRISVIAKGQRAKRKAAIKLEPFQKFRMQLRGNSDLKNLVSADALLQPIRLTGRDLFCGFYLNELLGKLLAQQDEDSALFDRYEYSLAMLAQGSQGQEKTLRFFEMQLFSYCGVEIDSSFTADGQNIDSSNDYIWCYGEGWMPLLPGSTEQAFSGAFIQQWAEQDKFNEAALSLYKSLHRKVLDGLLEGRELNSRKLFN